MGIPSREEHVKKHRKTWLSGPHRKFCVVGEGVRNKSRIEAERVHRAQIRTASHVTQKKVRGFHFLGSREAMGALKQGDEMIVFLGQYEGERAE